MIDSIIYNTFWHNIIIIQYYLQFDFVVLCFIFKRFKLQIAIQTKDGQVGII